MSTKQLASARKAVLHRRYVTLDGIRGFAAIAVALHHFDAALVPTGYVAVDIFFLLSGFVLAEAYCPRFASGLGVWQFARLRIVRLLPLYWAGLAFGALVFLQAVLRGKPAGMPLGEFALSAGINVLMLPSPFSGFLFPLNFPSWSLFYELLVNLLMAVLLWRLRGRGLAIVIAVAGMLLVALALLPPTSGIPPPDPLNGGIAWDDAPIAILRTLFAFTAGMLLARHTGGRAPHGSYLTWLIWGGLAALLIADPGDSLRSSYEALAVLLGAPLLVWAGIKVEPVGTAKALAQWLGDISYALYVVHYPLTHVFESLDNKLGVNHASLAPAYLATALLLAWIANRVDAPARRLLMAAIGPRRVAA